MIKRYKKFIDDFLKYEDDDCILSETWKVEAVVEIKIDKHSHIFWYSGKKIGEYSPAKDCISSFICADMKPSNDSQTW